MCTLLYSIIPGFDVRLGVEEGNGACVETRTKEYIYKRVDTYVNVNTQKYMVTVRQCGELHSKKYEY